MTDKEKIEKLRAALREAKAYLPRPIAEWIAVLLITTRG